MIFDQPPVELPRATLRTREVETRLWLDVRAWLASKWRWLRPRSIPVAVAGVGLVAVLASASYLRELALRTPAHVAARAAAEAVRNYEQEARLRIETGPAGAGVFVDGKQVVVSDHGGGAKLIQLAPGVYKVTLEPAAPAR